MLEISLPLATPDQQTDDWTLDPDFVLTVSKRLRAEKIFVEPEIVEKVLIEAVKVTEGLA